MKDFGVIQEQGFVMGKFGFTPIPVNEDKKEEDKKEEKDKKDK